MVYIYKKIIGLKTYYYLRASSRQGTKTLTQDIAYLGSTLEEVHHALERLPQYTKEIRKAYKTIHHFLESNHYKEKALDLKLKKDHYLSHTLIDIEACKIHYNTVFAKQPTLTKQEIYKNFVIEFAFNTTSIEGNTIKLHEARNLLQQDLTPKNKTIREVYDIHNTQRTFFHLLETSQPLTHDLIIQIHKMLMDRIDPRIGYRTTDVRVIKSNFTATPAPYVLTDMKLLLQWYQQYESKLHPLVLASLFHHKFEHIHPFMDGNGRTGRMLLNYILLSKNYPPLVIHTKTRKQYLNALRSADKHSLLDISPEQYSPLAQFIAQEMIESYWNIFL